MVYTQSAAYRQICYCESQYKKSMVGSVAYFLHLCYQGTGY